MHPARPLAPSPPWEPLSTPRPGAAPRRCRRRPSPCSARGDGGGAGSTRSRLGSRGRHRRHPSPTHRSVSPPGGGRTVALRRTPNPSKRRCGWISSGWIQRPSPAILATWRRSIGRFGNPSRASVRPREPVPPGPPGSALQRKVGLPAERHPAVGELTCAAPPPDPGHRSRRWASP